MGQVPTLLSLPLLLQGDRREEPPHLFPIYSSSRRTPGSRDRLSPGPRWGLRPLRSPGGALPPGHVYATLRGRGAGAASRPPVGRHYLPSRALACPGEDRSTHLHAHGPALSALSTRLCPIARCPPRGQEPWSLRPALSPPSHKGGWRLEGTLEQGHFSRASRLQTHPGREAAGIEGGSGVAEAITEGVDPVNRNFRQQ